MSANDLERIAGAKSCLDVILCRELVRPNPAHNFEENRAKRDAAIAALCAAAGEIPPQAIGVISVLAELILVSMDSGEFQHLEDWNPEAAMTSGEVAKHRAEVKAEYWDEDEAPAKCRVISLAERRATS